MDEGRITFDLGELNRLFPFYLTLDRELKTRSSGLSIQKICDIDDQTPFPELFKVIRPAVEVTNFDSLLAVAEKMVVVEYIKDPTIVMRGQFTIPKDQGIILFIGSPWFGSMDMVREKNLTVNDFAVHDSMIDLLHVLKTQEIATDDMKELLQTVNRQKNRLKEDQEELKIATKRAEEASRAMETFLTNMSHEIRTPLHAIIGMVRELGKEEMTPKQSTYLENARTASEHLLSIINNILDISKIEAGEFKLDRSHFKMRELIDETDQIMKGQITQKKFDFDISVLPSADTVFIGDPTRIRQILINLLGNAFKFTAKGKVDLKVLSEPLSEEKRKVCFVIMDTGIGMNELYTNELFKKFSQEDTSISRKFGGTGLGMALTSELIHLMGGVIDVESKKGEGTRIEIQLELPLGDEKYTQKPKRPLSLKVLKGRQILLVEDNAMNRLVASNALRVAGIVITEAINGYEAIRVLKKQSFDLILMDLQMPLMDGFKATEIIRKKMRIKTPIIALSANAFVEDINHGLEAGMDGFVTKPFEELTLLQAIAHYLGEELETESGSPVEDTNNGPDAGQPLYNLDKLVATSRGNSDFVRKMITLFVTSTPEAIEQINQAYSKGDFKTMGQTAHRIKPSIDNLGITSIQQDVRAIEQLGAEENDCEELSMAVHKVNEVLTAAVMALKEEAILKRD